MKKIAIFASGTGSNATKIIEHLANNEDKQVALIVSNKATAKVLATAKAHNIPTHIILRTNFYESDDILNIFNKYSVDYVVLAGFLWLIPSYLVAAYPNKIVNIHPALLPKYGGKGMYGMNVHKAVKENGENETGMTIHYVNEQYDDGAILFQASCQIVPEDTPQTIQQKVLQLEHRYFSKVVAELMDK